MYTHYFFDFDYTLADSSEGIVGCFHRTMEEWGLPRAADETITRTIGIPMEKAVGIIIESEDAAEINRFITAYKKYAGPYMTPGTHFYPSTVPTLTELKRRGAVTAIVSSKTGFRVQEKFTVTGTEHLIDLIIGSHDVKNLKPDPEGFFLALERLWGRPETTLYVGDSVTDALTAKNAGVDFVGVTTGVTPREELEALPHLLIAEDLSEILRL